MSLVNYSGGLNASSGGFGPVLSPQDDDFGDMNGFTRPTTRKRLEKIG